MSDKKKTIQVDYLARVEGEGALRITIDQGKVEHLELSIFEPPRFFEGFLRGRRFDEVADITSRICGICPVAYQMSSLTAMEAILGLTTSNPVRDLRRLLYCGEWIESHGLHVTMLHAPDFLGYEGAIEMAKDHPEIVKRSLAMKKIGNDLMTLVGGREIHPINLRVGGVYRAPSVDELRAKLPDLGRAREWAAETVRWVAGFSIPEYERPHLFVSLRATEPVYPIEEGSRIVSSEGLDIPVSEYASHFTEIHVPHSTALQATLHGRDYLLGPLARMHLNFDRLPEATRRLADEVGFRPPVNNPFRSIVARALELHLACEESIRLIEGYREPAVPCVPAVPRAGRGHGATEAPRGLLYHRYEIDAEGIIQDAVIIPPTSQNQGGIEADLRKLVEENHAMPEKDLGWRCEQLVRSFDPCISCATHFLKIRWERK